VEVGSPVSSILNLGANATLVMTIGDIDQVFVRGKVDEADIGRVRLGQPARIRVETFKEKTFNGRVTQISPMGVEKDNVTSFEVRVSIDNPGKELKANMTANAEIVLEEHPNALIVPESAVSYDAQKNAFVDVAAPGTKTGKKIGIVWGGRTSMQAGGERAGREIRLTLDDARALASESSMIAVVSPELTRGAVRVKSAYNAAAAQVTGIEPQYQEIRTIELQ